MTASAYLPINRKNTSLLHNTAALLRASAFRDYRDGSNAGHGSLLFQRADEAAVSGVYYPETLKAMRTAFDLAWKQASSMFEDDEKARRILAVQIFHHVDRGEHNIRRLATSGTDDLIALTGASAHAYSGSRSISAKAYAKRSFADYRALRQAT
jgi:hypothetical protein